MMMMAIYQIIQLFEITIYITNMLKEIYQIKKINQCIKVIQKIMSKIKILKKIKRESLSLDKSEIKSKNNKVEQSSETEIEKSENINKNNEEAIFKKLNKYYYNIEDNKFMKCAINKINYIKKNNMINSISYICYDTFCEARKNAIVNYNNIGEILNN